MDVTECQLCGSTAEIRNTVGRRPSSMWSYLYQENVRKALMPSLGDGEEKDGSNSGGNGVPKLTFTFSLGGTPCGTNVDSFLLCKECWERVDHLEKLHEQLESCKKLIAAEVEQIETVCGKSPGATRGERGEQAGRWNRKLESLWSMGAPGAAASVALAGTCVGGEHISQVLRSLDTLCGGMSHIHVNSSSSPPAPPKAYNLRIFNTSKPPTASPNATNKTENQNSSDDETIDGEDELTNSIKTDNDPDSDYSPPSPADTPGEEDEEEPPPFLSSLEGSPNPDSPALPIPKKSLGRKRKRATHKRLKGTAPVKSEIPSTHGKCKICGKVLHRKSMYYHVRTHSVETPYECEFCKRTLSRRDNLNTHIRLHTGAKPFICQLCGKSFVYQSFLNGHMLAHDKKKKSR